MRDEKLRQEPGGRRDDTCDHGLSRSWKVEVSVKKKILHEGIHTPPRNTRDRSITQLAKMSFDESRRDATGHDAMTGIISYWHTSYEEYTRSPCPGRSDASMK